MKLTKEQIIKIIQEELKETSCGDPRTKGHGQCFTNARKSLLDIIMSMQPEELAQLLQSPIMQIEIPAFNGYGKILNEAAHRYREFHNTRNFLAFLFQLEQLPSGRLL